jgi:threonine synthase
MYYHNINNPSDKVTLKAAVMQSPTDINGLYMPEMVPSVNASFIKNIHGLNLQEIAFEVAKIMFKNDVPAEELEKIIYDALSFDIPLVPVDDGISSLELFHGPTMAFKDVGARFMAGLFEYFMGQESQEVNILVATSGDTGSAVASAFLNKPGIKVTILYPSGKVSPLL